MKHERATEDTRQQSALYSLGLLTQHEAHCFELHLEECLVCRAEFAKLLLASAQIGLAVKEEDPPDGLRERLAGRIDSSAQKKHLSNLLEKQDSAPAPPPAESVKAPKPWKKPELVKKNSYGRADAPVPPRGRGKAAFVINAIIYVFFAALCAYAFYSWQKAEQEKFELQSRIETAENNQTDLQRQLESHRENTEKLERLQDMFNNPSVRVARLKGQPLKPDNTGAVLWNSLTGGITVIGTFDPAPAGMVYRLWLSAPTERITAGTLPSDRNGRIHTVVKLNQGVTAVSGITAIVTLESENDLPKRTEPVAPWTASGNFE